MPTDDDDNRTTQRVTNAVLQRDISYLTEKVKEFRDETRECTDDFRKRIVTLERGHERTDQRIDNLDQRVKGWDIANTAGVVIAGVLGALGLKQ